MMLLVWYFMSCPAAVCTTNSLHTLEKSYFSLHLCGNNTSLDMPPHGRGAYDQGKTAWQVLGRDAYEFLRPSHQWRLDEWSKDKCVSWACTLLLCHAHPLRHGRPVPRQRCRLPAPWPDAIGGAGSSARSVHSTGVSPGPNRPRS